MKTAKKIISLIIILSMALTILPAAFAAENASEGGWVYTVEGNSATILWSTGNKGIVEMFPAVLGGYQVVKIGNGTTNVTNNNKISGSYVLFPEGDITLGAGAIYDYNDTVGWSVPGGMKLESSSTLSISGTFYTPAGSDGETYAKATGREVSNEVGSSFTVKAGDNGYILPNGTYNIPQPMTAGSYSVQLTIRSDIGYKIKSLTVDGSDVAEATSKTDYTCDYTFSASSKEVSVEFEAYAEDTRTQADVTDYIAPEVIAGAVAEGATLPGDVNDYVGESDGTVAKYTNTMGVSTGAYYAAGGKVYEQVYSSQATTEAPEYNSKAEVINGVFAKEGLVYGKDYDLIRLYNYHENIVGGPGGGGEVILFCTYLYKEINEIPKVINVDNTTTNTASIFVQEGGNVTVSDLVTYCYTGGSGPSEAGNFFGLGSQIHADGGNGTKATDNLLVKNTSSLTLNNPQILGRINSIYATARGLININGGNVFSCTSGGHGPYVSTGGYITVNTDGTNLFDASGKPVTDVSKLTATEIQSSDLGTMTRDESGDMQGVYQEHAADVTVIVTGLDAGTALATDSGGGIIVANQVITKTFGIRCAGVYSIGSDESWVYCYNSNLNSYLDAGLCSASGGYIYAFNCDITGVMGVKTRAGQNSEENSEVRVVNSRVAAYYDEEEMRNVYDVGHVDDWDPAILDVIESGGASSDIGLNMFIDKANSDYFYEESITKWWFVDKSYTPGHSGGNKFAVVYLEGSQTPVYIESTRLYNRNYAEYGDVSVYGENAADNLLVSAEGGGTGNITFINENSQTKWDLTGKYDETCELTGDFFVAETAENADPFGQSSGGPSTLNATFINSEWEGTVLGYGYTCNLSFDKDSSWKVTADTTVGSIEGDASKITADSPVTVYYQKSSSIQEGTYGNVTFVKYYSRYFSDVTEYVDEIDGLADDEIIVGYDDGTFNPDGTISYRHFTLMLMRAADADGDNAIAWANENGFGLDIGEKDALTVEQIYEILFQAADTLNVEFEAASAVDAMKELLVYESSFTGTATRAQAAVLLSRYLAKQTMAFPDWMMGGGDMGGGPDGPGGDMGGGDPGMGGSEPGMGGSEPGTDDPGAGGAPMGAGGAPMGAPPQ